MIIKYLEWNLHAMGGIGYVIPGFIAEYINKSDIFVLTEFSTSKGWDSFEESLNSQHDLYCSPFMRVGYNQICIGIRKSLKLKVLSIKTLDSCNMKLPEFLQLDVSISNKFLSLIGVRIKTQGNSKTDQYKFLRDHINKIENVICLGDFNCDSSELNQKLEKAADVYGPRIVNGYFSFVFQNGDTLGLDWLITKGVSSVYNGYADSAKSPYATYDWSFITSHNGYDAKSSNDFLGIKGLPDHAILKGMIEI